MTNFPKFTLIGPSGVGKSSIMLRLSKGKFVDNTDTTIGGALINYINSELNFTITMWDTAGQEQYDSIIPAFLRGSSIIALTISAFQYDLAKVRQSVVRYIGHIFNTIHYNRSKPTYFRLVVLLSKCDLVDELEYEWLVNNVTGIIESTCDSYYREFSCDEAIEYYKSQFKDMEVIIVSSKMAIGFDTLNKKISRSLKEMNLESLTADKSIVDLEQGNMLKRCWC